MPSELVADEVFRVFLVFCRVGAALVILPGFGEPYVAPRLRLLLALGLSLLLAAALGPALPAAPAGPAALLALVGREVLVGLFLGAAARTMLAALHVAGTTIAYQSGLAGASVFDPAAATQGTLPGNFLTTAALVLLFVTDGHHALLQALAASYDGLPPPGDAGGPGPPLGGMAELFTRLAAGTITVGLRIAAPVVVVGLLLYLGLGVLNRLMPALQVFFIALPLQILLAFATLALSFAGGLLLFFAFFEDGLALLVLGGAG